MRNNIKAIFITLGFSVFLLTGCQSKTTEETEAKSKPMQDLLALPNTQKLTTLSGNKTPPEEIAQQKAQEATLAAEIAACAECGQKREFRGYFTYFADAAVLQECGSGSTFPITANVKMQNAYELNRSEPGAPLFFVAQGELAIRPSMEEGLTQRELVVDGDNWYFQRDGNCDL